MLASSRPGTFLFQMDSFDVPFPSHRLDPRIEVLLFAALEDVLIAFLSETLVSFILLCPLLSLFPLLCHVNLDPLFELIFPFNGCPQLEALSHQVSW